MKRFCKVVKADTRIQIGGSVYWVLTLECGAVVERPKHLTRGHRSFKQPTKVQCNCKEPTP
jgi:hypothetical protein